MVGRLVSRRHNCSGDDGGYVLVAVLIVLLVFGLILGAIFTNSNVSERNTLVTRTHLNKVYAADAGIDYAIQKLRLDSTYCAPTAGLPLPIAAPQIRLNN